MKNIETDIFPVQANALEDLLTSGFVYADDLREDLEELERRVWYAAILRSLPPGFMWSRTFYQHMNLLSFRDAFDVIDGSLFIVGHGAWDNHVNVRLLIDEVVRIVSQAFHVKNVKSYNYRHIIVIGDTHI